MNELPAEIFTKIMVLLPFGDKVEFMTVCKKWANVIQIYSLFETLRISSAQQLNRIVQKMENEPPEAKQVERLVLNLDIEPNFDLVHFFNQFPNLRVILIFSSESTQFQATTTPSRNNRIEAILDCDGCAMASYFLTSNKCSHLKLLDVVARELHTSVPRNFGNLYLNLPMLDMLTIYRAEITFDELETLHTLSPLLRTLNLLNLQIKDTELPTLIEPSLSTTVISITMDHTLALSIQIKFFQYASKKYPKLLDCEYTAYFDDDEDPDEITQFYKEGVIPFIRPLATQLRHCALSLDDIPEDLFIILEEVKGNKNWGYINIAFEDLDQSLRRFSQTNKTKYITDFSITCNPETDLTFLKELTALKDITIDSDHSNTETPFILNDILKLCSSTVEKISIYDVRMEYDPMDIREYKSIKTLSFNRMYINKGMDSFISRHLPNVNHISFDRCYFYETKFCLANINLLSLLIVKPYYVEHGDFEVKNHLNLLVCTQNDNQKRIWSTDSSNKRFYLNNLFGKYDHSVSYRITSALYNETMPYPDFTFELGSVKSIILRE